LGCAAGLTAASFAATGFARWRATDWSVDLTAAAVLAATFLPWGRYVFAGIDPFFGDPDPTFNAWQGFSYADVLLLLAVLTAAASVHTRGFLADPWIPVRASAVAIVAVVADLGWSELELGAPIGLACLLALLGVTLSIARGSRHLRQPRRGGVPALD
jgi:hypothetical protein